MSDLSAAATPPRMSITHDLPLEFADPNGSLGILGFWFFLGSDVVLFSCLFAVYAVYRTRAAGGPTPADILHYGPALAETVILLTSSFCCGLALHALRIGHRRAVNAWLAATASLGVAFVGLELHEFAGDMLRGASWQHSAFLSAFFTLVGTHGAHVSFGILWAITILIQLARRGPTARNARLLYTFSLYWHFLDIIWVFIFTVVYLMSRVS